MPDVAVAQSAPLTAAPSKSQAVRESIRTPKKRLATLDLGVSENRESLESEESRFVRIVYDFIISNKQFDYLTENHSDLLKSNLKACHKKTYKKILAKDKRWRIVEEIKSTEETYIHSLQQMVWSWEPELVKRGIISEKQSAQMFPSIDAIMKVNQQLYKELAAVIDEWSNSTSKIGHIFLKYGNFFKMYQDYLNSMDRSNDIVSELKTRRDFQDLAKELEMKSSGLRLDALLITPVQRIPRYMLLLRELIKNTDPSHVDHADLQEAFILTQEVSDTMNSKMKQFTQMRALDEIEKEFQLEAGVTIRAPGRVLKYKGNFKYQPHCDGKVTDKEGRVVKPEKRTCFLFNDCIIIANISFRGKFIIEHQYRINHKTKVINLPKMTWKNGFAVTPDEDSGEGFWGSCDSKNEKDNWVKLFKEAREEEMAKRESRQKVLRKSQFANALPFKDVRGLESSESEPMFKRSIQPVLTRTHTANQL